MRRFPLWLLPLALLASACGGGSTATVAASPLVIDLGTLSATVSTTVDAAFPVPAGGAATVVAVQLDGPFTFDDASLPLVVAAGSPAELALVASALGDGPISGQARLQMVRAGRTSWETYDLRARGETVQLTAPSTLDFGAVEVETSVDLEAALRNDTAQSPVTFSSVLVPSAAFELLSPAVPFTVEPGASVTLSVRYAPQEAGSDHGTLTLQADGAVSAVRIQLRAETVSGALEVVTDFGDQPLDSYGRTALLSVSVPADAVSLTLEGHIDGTATTPVIGLDTLTGPGSKVYENASSGGDYVWIYGWEIFSTTLPNTDRASVQLVPGGGTYQFRLRRIQGPGSTMMVRAIVERRPEATREYGTLDLNVFLAQGITPTATTAASDTRLQAVLTRMDAILSGQGVRLGDIDYYDVAAASYDEVTTSAEFASLLELTTAAADTRLNLFFVEVAFGGGVVGVSATISGPKKNGTEMSGVMSVYGGYSTTTIGLIAAHEIGHYLGLYHTVEEDGTHDFIDDTAECPSEGSDDTCTLAGGGYLMHWQALGGSDITDGQGLVVRGHPHLREGQAQAEPLSTRLTAEDLGEIRNLPRHWCGTCSGCRGD